MAEVVARNPARPFLFLVDRGVGLLPLRASSGKIEKMEKRERKGANRGEAARGWRTQECAHPASISRPGGFPNNASVHNPYPGLALALALAATGLRLSFNKSPDKYLHASHAPGVDSSPRRRCIPTSRRSTRTRRHTDIPYIPQMRTKYQPDTSRASKRSVPKPAFPVPVNT